MPDKEPRPDETDRRNTVRDQEELETARGGRRPIRQPTGQPESRAWRMNHTEVSLVDSVDPETSEVQFKMTDTLNDNHIEAPATSDDLEMISRMCLLRAERLRRDERRT